MHRCARHHVLILVGMLLWLAPKPRAKPPIEEKPDTPKRGRVLAPLAVGITLATVATSP